MNHCRMLVTLSLLASPALALAPASARAAGDANLGEAHARSAMIEYGCGNVSILSAGPAGSWHGQCSKGGKTIDVVMDSKGVVTSGNAPTHMTEANARSAMTAYGCSNVSSLGAGPNGSWHGLCLKGGQTVNVSMDSSGVVASGTPPQHLTDAHARSILTNFGCSGISALNVSGDGGWVGQCSKGGKTVVATVDGSGAVTTR